MAEALYQFGDFELDSRAYELRRGGQILHLERIPLDLLMLLIERRGELVTRDEILERIWGRNVFLDTANAVNTAVRKLRLALRDSADTPRIVATVPTKGYRFVAEVHQSTLPALGTQPGFVSYLPEPRAAKIAPTFGSSPMGSTPSADVFVGREDELRLLSTRWERVLRSEGQMVLVIGEAGIGKSRLALQFRQQLAGSVHLWIRATAVPYFQNTPFWLVGELLRDLLAELYDNRKHGSAVNHRLCSPDHETSKAHLAQLERMLELSRLAPAEELPLFAPLLNLPLPAKYPPRNFAPDQQRRCLLGGLVRLLTGVARARPPLSIVAEDLQWADPSSLELLTLIAEQGATAPLLLIYVARPEFHVSWSLRSHTQIGLNRLTESEACMMVKRIAAGVLPEATVTAVAERAAGVPLFIEQLTRAMLDGVVSISDFGRAEPPATLLGSIRARLDRLGPARETLEASAVLGGEFSYELLHAVQPIDSECFERHLHSLADAELLDAQGLAPEATYRFKHDLIRDAVYLATPVNRRRQFHLRAALVLREQFPGLAPAEVLARHWREGGETESAIEQWVNAARAAEARNAFPEALESYRQALTLLLSIPETPEQPARELKLRQSVLWMLIFVRGNAAPETIEAAERAIALAEQCGRFSQMVHLMIVRGHSALNAGDLSNAAAIGNRAVELALRDGHTGNLAYVYSLQIATRYNRGDLAGVERYFAEGLRYFENPLPFLGVGVPAVGAAAPNAWMMGCADTARERETKMIALMNDDKHYHRAFGAYYAAILHILLKEYDQAEAWVTQAFEISVKHQFPFPVSLSKCVLGYVRGQLGRPDEGLELLSEGISELNQGGSHIVAMRNMMWLAELLCRRGQLTRALETIKQALRVNPEGRVYVPEILRLRAEMLIRQGAAVKAESELRRGIELARWMGAIAWELRLATTLARNLTTRQQRAQASVILRQIKDRFVEGFSTADMRDAQELLDQLR